MKLEAVNSTVFFCSGLKKHVTCLRLITLIQGVSEVYEYWSFYTHQLIYFSSNLLKTIKALMHYFFLNETKIYWSHKNKISRAFAQEVERITIFTRSSCEKFLQNFFPPSLVSKRWQKAILKPNWKRRSTFDHHFQTSQPEMSAFERR